MPKIAMVLRTAINTLFTTLGGTSSNSINGKWLSSGGLGVNISGSSGTFYSFNSNFQTAANKGYVQLGSLYLKNI